MDMISENERIGIDHTRLFMILCVILAHSNILVFIQQYSSTTIVSTVIRFFSEMWPRFCVPWFFYISAYLNNTKYERFTKHTYLNFIKKRVKSILLPYILWNLLALLTWQTLNWTILSNYTSGGYHFTTIIQFLYDVFINPILLPLWFLRNLIILTVLLPLFQIILRKSAILLIILSLLFEVFVPFAGFFYYAMGMVTVNKNIKSILINRYPVIKGSLYILVTLLSTITYFPIFEIPFLGDLVIFLGLSAFYGINLNYRILPFKVSPSAVFFVYAFRGIISPYVRKGLTLFVPCHGNFWLIDYVMVFLILVTLSFATYFAASKIAPKIVNILTGQREIKSI